MKSSVRCTHCELVQYEAEKCRRCHAELPTPIINGPVEFMCCPTCLEINCTRMPTLAEIERALITKAVEMSGGKPLKAAAMLGIGKSTIYRKLQELDLR